MCSRRASQASSGKEMSTSKITGKESSWTCTGTAKLSEALAMGLVYHFSSLQVVRMLSESTREPLVE